MTARKLKTAASAEFRDVYAIRTDPGLKTLPDVPPGFLAAPPTAAQTALAFGRQFFYDADPAGRPTPAAGFYKPKAVPPPPAFMQGALRVPVTLAWRTAEQAAEPARDFNTPAVREKVVAAWKRVEARKLAKKAADGVAAAAGTFGTGGIEIETKVMDARTKLAAQLPPADAAKVTYSQVGNVAPLAPVTLPGETTVGRFAVPRTDVIPYPTAKMAADLLAVKDKPPGTAVVLADAPEDTYYAAVLLFREDPIPGQFATLVFGSQAAVSKVAGPVRRAHQVQLKKQAREQAVALIKAEFGYDKESDTLDKKTSGDPE